MKTLEEKIAVMQAAVEGKEIEVSRLRIGRWEKLNTGHQAGLDWSCYDYRVKKVPEKVYMVYSKNLSLSLIGYIYTTKEAAEKFKSFSLDRTNWVVQEVVLED